MCFVICCDVMLCPLCGSMGDADVWLSVKGYDYAACPTCGAVRLVPFPDREAALSLYDDSYFETGSHGGYVGYTVDERLHRRNGRSRMRRLGAPQRPGEILVDVGCAFGYTMVEAARSGWQPMGVEVNERARLSAASEGFSVAASFDGLRLGPHGAGAVTFFQVLEHMPDPVGALSHAASVLATNGRVLIETWDRDSVVARLMGRHWQQASPPSVLWLFDKSDLRRMSSLSGFDLVKCRSSTKWVSLGLVTGQLAARKSRFGRALHGGLGRVPLLYCLGDLVTVELRKLG